MYDNPISISFFPFPFPLPLPPQLFYSTPASPSVRRWALMYDDV